MTDAMEYGVRAYLGQATQSEITGGARKLIEQLEQKSGTTEDDLRCLAGIKKILSILEEEIPVSKEEIDAYIESYSLTSVYCKTLAIADPETDALLNASVKNVWKSKEKIEKKSRKKAKFAFKKFMIASVLQYNSVKKCGLGVVRIALNWCAERSTPAARTCRWRLGVQSDEVLLLPARRLHDPTSEPPAVHDGYDVGRDVLRRVLQGLLPSGVLNSWCRMKKRSRGRAPNAACSAPISRRTCTASRTKPPPYTQRAWQCKFQKSR
ncbi:hypothetical protein HYV43_01875 [Candidatus Micrarchaeota archaeon]|nr:hypothetical protein [Candidatus Micrarchaeota archaeon]